jgi:hypothetical protein
MSIVLRLFECRAISDDLLLLSILQLKDICLLGGVIDSGTRWSIEYLLLG